MRESQDLIEEAVRNHQSRFGVSAETSQMRFFNAALLAVMSEDPFFEVWVLKGGGSLNLVYYGADFSRETRDLDFAVSGQQPEQLVWDNMHKILGELERRYGIRCSDLRVDFGRSTPKIEIRHRDYERDISVIQIPRSKIDADREANLDGAETLSLAELFPEISSFRGVNIRVYSINEILAEKLRALLQRWDNSYLYCKHLFDITFILSRDRDKVDVAHVLELFRKKCDHAGVTSERSFEVTKARAPFSLGRSRFVNLALSVLNEVSQPATMPPPTTRPAGRNTPPANGSMKPGIN